MIVSHKDQFIFVHVGRTGGSSITAELAKHCGPKDLVILGKDSRGLRKHSSARDIMKHVGQDVWDRYFKFTFERNPWDKIISRYWAYRQDTKTLYKNIVPKLTFQEWFWLKVWHGRLLGLGHIRFPQHLDDYCQQGRPVVDFVGLYERRVEHLQMLSKFLKLPISTETWLGKKRGMKRRPYQDLFDASMRKVVDRLFEKDLQLLGYRFGQPAPKHPLITGTSAPSGLSASSVHQARHAV